MESPGELVELSAFTVSARRQTGTFLPANPQSGREFRRLPSRTVLTPIFARGTSNCVETDALCFDNSEKQRNIFKDTKGRSRNKFLFEAEFLSQIRTRIHFEYRCLIPLVIRNPKYALRKISLNYLLVATEFIRTGVYRNI